MNNNINFAKKKLDVGDYTVGIIENDKKKSFEGEIVIERKNSLSELSQNLFKHRERFIREISSNLQLHLVIEDGSWDDIFEEKYRGEVNSKSYIATLMTFLQRYNIYIHMVSKEDMGQWIYNLLYYFVREKYKEE